MASPYGSAIFLCVPTGIIPPLAGWLVRRRVVHHRSHMLAPVPANTHHHISPNPSRHRREGSHRLKNKRSKVWRMPYFRPCVPTGIRTPVAAVKGRCPWPLDDGDVARDQCP